MCTADIIISSTSTSSSIGSKIDRVSATDAGAGGSLLDRHPPAGRRAAASSHTETMRKKNDEKHNKIENESQQNEIPLALIAYPCSRVLCSHCSRSRTFRRCASERSVAHFNRPLYRGRRYRQITRQRQRGSCRERDIETETQSERVADAAQPVAATMWVAVRSGVMAILLVTHAEAQKDALLDDQAAAREHKGVYGTDDRTDETRAAACVGEACEGAISAPLRAVGSASTVALIPRRRLSYDATRTAGSRAVA